MNFTIQTPFDQVYLLAEMIGEMATGESLRVPVRDQPAQRVIEVEHLEPSVGRTVTFEVLLADGAVALRGRGTLRRALRVEGGMDLELSSQQIEGPAATLVWELQRQLRSDRRSRPSIPPIWDDETVGEDVTIPDVRLPVGFVQMDINPTLSGTFLLDIH